MLCLNIVPFLIYWKPQRGINSWTTNLVWDHSMVVSVRGGQFLFDAEGTKIIKSMEAFSVRK